MATGLKPEAPKLVGWPREPGFAWKLLPPGEPPKEGGPKREEGPKPEEG